MGNQQYSGNPYQTPVKFRASRQTTEESPRYSYGRQTTTRKQISDDDTNDDAWAMPKPRTSTIDYRSRTRDMGNPKRTRRVRQRTFDRYTLMIVVGLALIVMIGGWLLFSFISSWWTNWQDDLHYGNPRTYQVDQFVGQGDSPDHPDHFIAVNSHGQVFVVQINPLNPKLDQIYGITTASDPKTPVSLSFRPTGNTWAMYVIVGDTTPYSVEYVSNGQKFVPASS